MLTVGLVPGDLGILTNHYYFRYATAVDAMTRIVVWVAGGVRAILAGLMPPWKKAALLTSFIVSGVMASPTVVETATVGGSTSSWPLTIRSRDQAR